MFMCVCDTMRQFFRIANFPRELRACLEDGDAFSAAALLLSSLVAENKTGYFSVTRDPNRPGLAKPYQARVRRGGEQVHLGHFATAEEAALCIASTLYAGGREGAYKAGAQADRLTLLVTESKTGFLLLWRRPPGRQAQALSGRSVRSRPDTTGRLPCKSSGRL